MAGADDIIGRRGMGGERGKVGRLEREGREGTCVGVLVSLCVGNRWWC